ncbi:MAG: DUF4019 domain-containing protein [Deltaproteobacteria bacterium]|nr:DUF4019 domain-containing protein [Deltaproteobacteria bacterium]
MTTLRIRTTVAVTVLILAAGGCNRESADSPKQGKAQGGNVAPVEGKQAEQVRKAATDWLGLADAKDWGASWDRSAEMFRKAVKKEQWAQSADAARSPLGDRVSRKEKSLEFSDSLPGAPDGEYAVLQFATEFARKKEAVETLSLLHETDGQWRVVGYFIK